ncbi:hypothetical protein STEG23_003195 [Scotinomys teguina]
MTLACVKMTKIYPAQGRHELKIRSCENIGFRQPAAEMEEFWCRKWEVQKTVLKIFYHSTKEQATLKETFSSQAGKGVFNVWIYVNTYTPNQEPYDFCFIV